MIKLHLKAFKVKRDENVKTKKRCYCNHLRQNVKRGSKFSLIFIVIISSLRSMESHPLFIIYLSSLFIFPCTRYEIRLMQQGLYTTATNKIQIEKFIKYDFLNSLCAKMIKVI